MKEQPAPQGNDTTPIVDQVIEDLKERKKVGIERYGVPLQAHNGRNSAQDLYEELLDAVQYTKQLMIENEDFLNTVYELEITSDAVIDDLEKKLDIALKALDKINKLGTDKVDDAVTIASYALKGIEDYNKCEDCDIGYSRCEC